MSNTVKMDPTIKEEILAVRDDGRTNMFDINGVIYVANDLGLFDLVCYLSERDNAKEYTNFILYGDGE